MNASARVIHARPGLGATARVAQGRELVILRIRIDQPVLILVERGVKTVRAERGAQARAQPGQAIVLAGGQTVDFRNAVSEGAHYAARWLVFDPALLDDASYRDAAARSDAANRPAAPVCLLADVDPALTAAVAHAEQALAPDAVVPDAIARLRLLEAMHWLLEAGIVLHSASLAQDVSARVRTLTAGRLERDWSAGRVASELALSEATLRRRLAAEGTSLSALLVEARMATALTLLQATEQPVSDIAAAVGYESPSRFAVRFRQRFGFAPTAVRGHDRAQ
ncbi:AraC family transcriptional regulator [Massilia sp. 9096]|uniref:helix-turn-helix transcriptional regulator n=1 Tax=Massilia sp. 9096 TaxID=1500894 RepID=UPI000567A143|nr:AraC family transcriptional regulator [Massilia sp. 9096]